MRTRKLKLMIFGHGRHGKDTVAELISKVTTLRFQSSSWIVSSLIYADSESYTPLIPPPPEFASYESVDQMYEERHKHRKFWHEWIIAFNTPDLSKLSQHILTTYDIYVGIRNPDEYYQAKSEGLFDLGIWVDRSKHLPPESRESNKMTQEMADIVIDNNGTLADLQTRVARFVSTLRNLQDGVIGVV